uniref:Putative secreted protein n=1 Tax=Anopheles darlingi TaxID=43151 RepID=A0A2M4D6S6_ANODA
MPGHRVATGILTILLPATIALLSGLHHTVATDGLLWFGEAALGTAGLRVQHRFDGFQGARTEPVVVAFVARRGTGKHDEVTILAARCTLFGIVR